MQMMVGEDKFALGKMKLCVQVNRQPGENVLSGYQWRLCAGKGMTRVHGESRTDECRRAKSPKGVAAF